MRIARFVVPVVIRISSQAVVLGCLGVMQRSHAVVIRQGFIFLIVFQVIVKQGVVDMVFRNKGVFIRHRNSGR